MDSSAAVVPVYSPTAQELVEYGLVPGEEETETCRYRGRAINAGHGFPDPGDKIRYRNCFGLRWYKKCKGSEDDYWDNLDRYKRSPELANELGLVATHEWKIARSEKDIYLVVASQNCRTQAIGTGPMALKFAGMSYAIVHSKAQLMDLYKGLPPADRFLQEVILPSTPHKVVMDIERDFDSSMASDAEMRRSMAFMKRGLHEIFVPLICKFFSNKLGIEITRNDCYLTDSSKHGVKFSTHLVITTKAGHYFPTRTDEWIVMALLAKYVRIFADENQEFRRWFYFTDPRDRVRSTWDFGIYGKGARNMRLLGACKANNKTLGGHWLRSRVFVPINEYGLDQRGEPYENFIASVYDTRNKTPIELSNECLLEVRDFVLAIRQEPLSSVFWFQNSLRLAHFMMANELVPRIHNNSNSCPRSYGQQPSSSSSGPNTFRGRNQADLTEWESALMRIRKEIMDLSQGQSGSSFFNDLASYDQNIKARFMEHARQVLKRVIVAVHPECGHVEPVSPIDVFGSKQPVLLTSKFFPRKQIMNAYSKEGKAGRMCYFGCTTGGHSVVLSINVDLSVDYFCYACRGEERIFDSQVVQGVVPLRVQTTTSCPVDFDHGFIDYAVVPPGPMDDDRHMRTIGAVECDGVRYYIPPGRHQRTVVAQGTMGSGKTVMTSNFLDKVREQNAEAKIVAFSFRRMLASMFAASFKLDDYSKHSGLYTRNGVAIQLESLLRLSKASEENGEPVHKFHQVYDVVIIDEVESVLAHFASSTMVDRLYLVWRIFHRIVTNCRCLVVCDADVGPRTFQFLRMTRARAEPRIPLLEFHYNTKVAIKTKFYDYMGEAEWYNQLLSFILSGKNVFFFSNNKKRMRAIKQLLVDDLSRMKANHIKEVLDVDPFADLETDAQLLFIDSIMGSILVVDADITEREKELLANCNDEWIKYKLVMISPAVGAGIDFTRKHFHVSFGFATAFSCSARAINQMRGRVREVLLGECHMYINEAPDKEMQLAVEEKVRDEGGMGPGFRDGETEEALREFDAATADVAETANSKPFTLGAALEQLRVDKIRYVSDMVTISESHFPSDNFVVRSISMPDELATILALNTVERNRSQVCFRGEFIRILQMGDPDVEYRFDAKYSHATNLTYKLKIIECGRIDADNRQSTISKQQELDRERYKELLRESRGHRRPPDPEELPPVQLSEEQQAEVERVRQEQGDGAAEVTQTEMETTVREEQIKAIELSIKEKEANNRLLLPDGVINERAMHAMLQKNDIKHFYGIKDNVPIGLWNQMVRCAGDDETTECVRRLCRVLGCNLQTLHSNDTDRGALRALDMRLQSDEQTGLQSRNIPVGARTLVEVWPSDTMLRWWACVLLWASGFDVAHPTEAVMEESPMQILPGVGCGSGHRYFSTERLQDAQLQRWIRERSPYIMRKVGIHRRRNQNSPKELTDDWEAKHVFGLTRDYFVKCFNLQLTCMQVSKQKRKGLAAKSAKSSEKGKPRKKRKLQTSLSSSSSQVSESVSETMSEHSAESYASKLSTNTIHHEQSMNSLLCHCPVRDPNKDVMTVTKRCPRMFHGKGNHCGTTLHVNEDSLALMISLAYMHLNTEWMESKEEPPMREIAREQLNDIIGAWNRHPFLIDYHVSAPSNRMRERTDSMTDSVYEMHIEADTEAAECEAAAVEESPLECKDSL